MANASLNLATRSIAERADIAADKEACRLIHYRKQKGEQWREWVATELETLSSPDRVRHFLNSRLGIGK